MPRSAEKKYSSASLKNARLDPLRSANPLVAWFKKIGDATFRGGASCATRTQILVSEIMLQADTGRDGARLLRPVDETLYRFRVACRRDGGFEVLAQWQGLGYYSRARKLHRAAQIVMREHDGKMPPLPR